MSSSVVHPFSSIRDTCRGPPRRPPRTGWRWCRPAVHMSMSCWREVLHTCSNASIIRRRSRARISSSDQKEDFRTGPGPHLKRCNDVFRSWGVDSSGWMGIGRETKSLGGARARGLKGGMAWVNRGTWACPAHGRSWAGIRPHRRIRARPLVSPRGCCNLRPRECSVPRAVPPCVR